ncbi:ribulose-5-phosphate 3-epimerase [Pisolithus thermaeus]|nr:ribulose-5-phosphate 3-epimerase [Pisolithus thermaeus]
MPRPIISPSVLASDFGQLTIECKRMINGGAEWLHMGTQSYLLSDYAAGYLHLLVSPDVMDGHFVPNITIGPPVLSCVARSIPGIFMDCHMMVEHPEKWVGDIAAAGGSLYCFHIEATSDPLSLIKAIHDKNMKAGVAISPDTPSAAITGEIGAAADMLLVMTVYPGRGGQKFLDRCVPKVAELRARFPDKDIEVDGGVGPKTCTQLCRGREFTSHLGSNVIVAGTAIFHADNPEEVITALKNAVVTAQTNRSA